MLKFGKIYIHFLFLAMLAVFAMNGHIYEIALSYGSMLLHETAHAAAAAAVGLRISHIALYPFGVNLRLKSKMVARTGDELILYLSGPAVNALLALLALRLGQEFLYRVNTLLFVMNLLPVYPLDGGCILKRLLTGRFGSRAAAGVMRALSAVFAVIFIALGIYAVYATRYNYSVLLLAVFMVGNVFTQREKYNTAFLHELMFYREKPVRRAKLIAAREGDDPRETARLFVPGRFAVVCTVDDEGRVKGWRTEREIIDGIVSETIPECYKIVKNIKKV